MPLNNPLPTPPTPPAPTHTLPSPKQDLETAAGKLVVSLLEMCFAMLPRIQLLDVQVQCWLACLCFLLLSCSLLSLLLPEGMPLCWLGNKQLCLGCC